MLEYNIEIVKYIIIASLTVLLVPQITIKKRSFDTIIFALLTITLLVFTCFRDRTIGYDTDNYVNYFNEIGENNLWTYMTLEPLYVVFNNLLYKVFPFSQAFLIVVGILTTVPICFFIYRRTGHYSVIGFILFVFFNWESSMYLMRQYLAIFVCLINMGNVRRRKLIPFIILEVIAVLFHKSALVFIIIYPVNLLKYSKELVFFTIGVSLLMVVFGNQLLQLIDMITGYDYQSFGQGGGLYIYLLTIITALLLLFVTNRIRPFYKKTMLISILISSLSLYMGMFYRVNLYFMVVIYVIYPCLFRDFLKSFREPKRKIVKCEV